MNHRNLYFDLGYGVWVFLWIVCVKLYITVTHTWLMQLGCKWRCKEDFMSN